MAEAQDKQGEKQPDQFQAAPGVKRPRVFFDITVDNNSVGKIVFELFSVSSWFLFDMAHDAR